MNLSYPFADHLKILFTFDTLENLRLALCINISTVDEMISQQLLKRLFHFLSADIYQQKEGK